MSPAAVVGEVSGGLVGAVTGALAGALVLVSAASGRAALRLTRAAGMVRRIGALVHDAAPAAAGSSPRIGRAPAGARRWLLSALPEADPDRAWRMLVVGVAVAALAGLVAGGPYVGLVALVGAAVGAATGLRLARHRGDVAYEAVLPAALDALGRSLRSGASLLQAVGEAAAAVPGPLGDDLAQVGKEAVRGVPIVQALEGWATRRPLPSVRLASAALCMGAELGGAHARAVEGIAATVRDRLGAAAELRSLATQARASAAVLVAAPVAFTAFAAATDAGTASFLRTPLGAGVLLGGLVLDAAGALWMGAIVRGATR